MRHDVTESCGDISPQVHSSSWPASGCNSVVLRAVIHLPVLNAYTLLQNVNAFLFGGRARVSVPYALSLINVALATNHSPELLILLYITKNCKCLMVVSFCSFV